jgi:hypothetical protein
MLIKLKKGMVSSIIDSLLFLFIFGKEDETWILKTYLKTLKIMKTKKLY